MAKCLVHEDSIFLIENLRNLPEVEEVKTQLVLDRIKEDPTISKQEMSIKGELTKKSVEYNVTLLKKKGILRRSGADRGGHQLLRYYGPHRGGS